MLTQVFVVVNRLLCGVRDILYSFQVMVYFLNFSAITLIEKTN